MGDRRSQVVLSMGCSRLALALPTPSVFGGGHRSTVPMSPAASSSDGHMQQSAGPFAGLIICVTGLSKARLDESLYSVNSLVHPGLPLEEFSQLVAITNAEHSCLPLMSHEDKKALSIATQYSSQSVGREVSKNGGSILSGLCLYIDADVSSELHEKVVEAARREGASYVDHWFIGCSATHVVCEGTSVQRYIGYTTNLVTPLWVLKTARERFMQRLVHFSADLARQVAIMLDNSHNSHLIQSGEIETSSSLGDSFSLTQVNAVVQQDLPTLPNQSTSFWFRNTSQGSEGHADSQNNMLFCANMENSLVGPTTTSPLLATGFSGGKDAPCQASAESILSSFSTSKDIQPQISSASMLCSRSFAVPDLPDSSDVASTLELDDSSIMQRGSWKQLPPPVRTYTKVYKPIDISRYKNYDELRCELARMFGLEGQLEDPKRSGWQLVFVDNENGGTHDEKNIQTEIEEREQRMNAAKICVRRRRGPRMQENMSPDEIEVAIHTDSKHADRLRSLYASKEAVDLDYVPLKRIEFLGSRRSFEALKRVSRENTGQVYELWLGA